MKVVLAEKPSVARDLARILEAKVRRDGYFEGNGYQVSWAIGHLVGLADTRDYGFPRWDLANLPIIPREFKTKVTGDSGRARQFHIVANLFKEAEEIICATDAGREGELIFRYIYQLSGTKAPFKRLWISSQTDKAIKDGLAKLKDGVEYDPLYHAARCRSEADWLVGINATQAYTLRYANRPPFFDPEAKSRQPLSLGRVQTPVLKLLVDRWQEVQAFNAETYWELILTMAKDESRFQAKWFNEEGDRFLKEEDGQAILAKLSGKAIVSAANRKPKNERPPLLYDLTELQKDANKRYDLSAQRTLDLAQDLYEKYKTITYPRTDSRYLTSDLHPGMEDLMRNVARLPAYAPYVEKVLTKRPLPKDKRVFDDKKVSDHHAIIPTETNPSSAGMTAEHFKIYDLIVRRLIAAFLGNCEKELSEIVLSDSGENFRAKGTMIKTNGWREIYQALDKALAKRKSEKSGKKKSKKEEEEELPYVQEGEALEIVKSELPKKKTKAPPVHTESSILAMMETAGKELEDEELREAMKEGGLGTPATRAGMIERLLQRKYIQRNKKKLVPTDRGISLINLVRNFPISSPELTGEWEMRLNKISKKEVDPDKFMGMVRKYTLRVVNDAKGVIAPRREMPNYALEATCPKCKEGNILKGKRAFGCARYREGCDFLIKPLIAGKMVEKEHLEELIKEGQTSRFVQGFTSRAGKRFDARLRFGEDWKVNFFFKDDTSPPSEKKKETTVPEEESPKP